MPRVLEYLSPTSISDFEKDREEFYLQRLAAARPDRFPQTIQMSIGSAFDAKVKSHLYELLYGNTGSASNNAKFSYEALFESQVEPHNRDWARVNGPVAFEYYKNSGALADLLIDLHRAKGEISFESEIRGTVHGVTLLGKPDCYYINHAGQPVILDWKVNGWCGRANKSPNKGYVRLRACNPGGNPAKMHPDCIPIEKHGVRINGAITLDQVDASWAAQLAIYAWIFGAPVGSEFICAIDQIACDGSKGTVYPVCRIAEHRLLCGKTFQEQLLAKAQKTWQAIQTGHIFTEMSKEDNDAKCANLEDRAQLFRDNPTFAEQVRERKW